MFFIILSAFSTSESAPRAVASDAPSIASFRKPRSLPLAVLTCPHRSKIFRGVFNSQYAIFHTKYGIRRMNHSTQGASRPDVAAQVDEIAAAIVSPRGRGHGRAFIGSLRLFRPVAHRLHAARIDAEADQEIPDRARPAIAEAEIVLRRAARVTVAFDAEGDRAIALEIEPIGQSTQLVLLRLEQVGFVVVEKDRLGSFLELLGGRWFLRRRRRGGDHRRRRRRFGDRDARAGGGGAAV